MQVKEETQTLATITLQNFFKLYKKICGMTGTAMTEANEFWKIYKLDVIAIPTNQPLQRVNHPDVIFRSETARSGTAVVDEMRRGPRRLVGRSCVGTVSIEKSEQCSADQLEAARHQAPGAQRQAHEREAEIVAQAGRQGAVTIATNMAGRGTDIILGGNPETMAWAHCKTNIATRLDVPQDEWDEPSLRSKQREKMKAEGREVAELGGLHIIGTERHEAAASTCSFAAVAVGKAIRARSRFYLSLEDDLMRIFAGEWVKNVLTALGMKEGEAIESRMVSRRIEGAQKKVEERHFEVRKNLLEYDEVMDEQRKRVYGFRQRMLDGAQLQAVDPRHDRQADRGQRPPAARCRLWPVVIRRVRRQSTRHRIRSSEFRGSTYAESAQLAKDRASRNIPTVVHEALDENLPNDTERASGNGRPSRPSSVGGTTSNCRRRSRQKIGREDLPEKLIEMAEAQVQRVDLTKARNTYSPIGACVRARLGAS